MSTTSTTSTVARSRKRRTASALAVVIALTGITAGAVGTASATTMPPKKCFVEVYYDGHWTKVQVSC
ncbi:hypothetical protein GCM10009665_54180 [Kitasatospora nipponensis]|uniref:Uncharacterized protein n=1 Tax=Kitasatospora nipponensis TaxID=258049 RepID=A0ABN1WRQ6_9ACTN